MNLYRNWMAPWRTLLIAAAFFAAFWLVIYHDWAWHRVYGLGKWMGVW